MQEIWTVISSETGPNSTEFWFVLNDNKGVPVKKGNETGRTDFKLY